MDVLLRLPDQLGQNLTKLPNYDGCTAKAIQDALEEQADLDRYQRAKIRKGMQAAKDGQFASDKEVEAFFDKWK